MILAGFAIVIAVAIAELVMAARWNPSYLTGGVPIFARRVERPNGLDGVSIEELGGDAVGIGDRERARAAPAERTA